MTRLSDKLEAAMKAGTQEEVPRAAFDAVPLSSERLADHRPLNRGEAND